MKTQKTVFKTLLIFSLCFIAPLYCTTTQGGDTLNDKNNFNDNLTNTTFDALLKDINNNNNIDDDIEIDDDSEIDDIDNDNNNNNIKPKEAKQEITNNNNNIKPKEAKQEITNNNNKESINNIITNIKNNIKNNNNNDNTKPINQPYFPQGYLTKKSIGAFCGLLIIVFSLYDLFYRDQSIIKKFIRLS